MKFTCEISFGVNTILSGYNGLNLIPILAKNVK